MINVNPPDRFGVMGDFSVNFSVKILNSVKLQKMANTCKWLKIAVCGVSVFVEIQ